MSRQLEFMEKALKHIEPIRTKPEKEQKAYGALCHKLPMYVLNDGLYVTAAYIESKAKPGNAFDLVESHLKALLKVPNGSLTTYLASSPAIYQRSAIAVLDAWVFYKRFAVSRLGVKPGDTDGEQALDDLATQEERG